MRAAGINVLQQRPDGTIHMGMGGGVTTDRKSITATRDAIGLAKFVKDLQDEVTETIQGKVTAAGLPPDTEVRLEWRCDVPFVVTDPSAFEIDLTESLKIPPL